MAKGDSSWNRIFKREGKVFEKPHEDIPRFIRFLQDKGASTVLDLGCGSGRHVVALAQNGFSVYGLDNSPKGLDITEQWLKMEGLSADLRLHDMTAGLPYEDGLFDAIISVQVIHHARLRVINNLIEEISRTLKNGGFLFVSVPTHRYQAENFEEIEPGTFIPLDGWEKGLPHHYFTEASLRSAFKAYEIIDLHVDNSDHFCLSAVKNSS